MFENIQIARKSIPGTIILGDSQIVIPRTVADNKISKGLQVKFLDVKFKMNSPNNNKQQLAIILSYPMTKVASERVGFISAIITNKKQIFFNFVFNNCWAKK